VTPADLQIQNPNDLAARIGSGWGLSSQDRTPFGLHPLLLERGGYLEWTKKEIAPAYERGYRRFIRHRPLGEGVKRDRDMDMDSVFHLRESEHAHVEEDYRVATQWCLDNMPDAVFIDYFGTDEPDLRGLYADGEFQAHWERMFGSFEPAIGFPNVDIAMDAATRWPIADSELAIYAALAHALRSYKEQQGRRVFIEALPMIGSPGKEWQHQFAGIALEKFNFHKIKWTERLGKPWTHRLHDANLETVRWYTGHMKWKDWHLEWTPAHIVADCMLRPNSSPFLKTNMTWFGDETLNDLGPMDWTERGLDLVRDAATQHVKAHGFDGDIKKLTKGAHDVLVGNVRAEPGEGA